jgi:hypothetical protein
VFIYDEATTRLAMQQAGLVDIRRASFVKGRDPNLLLGIKVRAVESLYMETSKPYGVGKCDSPGIGPRRCSREALDPSKILRWPVA